MRFRKTHTSLILANAWVFALSAWAQPKTVGPSSAGPRPNAVRPYVACAGAMPALPPRAQQKPFTQKQVSNMVRDGFGDESGAKLIEQRGMTSPRRKTFLQSPKRWTQARGGACAGVPGSKREAQGCITLFWMPATR